MDVQALLRTKLSERCSSLTAAFRKLDHSNTGFLTPADFTEVLRGFGVRVTRPALAALMAKYDANGDGVVSYEEFCATMSGTPSASLATAPAMIAPSAADKAEESFRRIIFASSVSITSAFLKLDKDRSGFCDPAELAAVFTANNIQLGPKELAAVVAHADTNGDGRVDIRELAKIIDGGARFETARGMKRSHCS
mmetsp:Transcript_26627/g.85604  ORF Transcript_26627/g.85604 Transcript_26627/m.85604 type:complete len:195 (-) Transcript_26627:392-976(-)